MDVSPHGKILGHCSNFFAGVNVFSDFYIPRSCSKSCEPSLKHGLHQDERILPRKQEVDSGQCDTGMKYKSCCHSDDIEPESLGYSADVIKVQDLTTDQKHNTDRRIPVMNR